MKEWQVPETSTVLRSGRERSKKYIKKYDSMLERSPEVKPKLSMLTELVEALTR